jgi:hypothetical protein
MQVPSSFCASGGRAKNSLAAAVSSASFTPGGSLAKESASGCSEYGAPANQTPHEALCDPREVVLAHCVPYRQSQLESSHIDTHKRNGWLQVCVKHNRRMQQQGGRCQLAVATECLVLTLQVLAKLAQNPDQCRARLWVCHLIGFDVSHAEHLQ